MRRVGVLGLDQTQTFTIIALGEALAEIQKINIDARQLDGTMQVFNIYPEGAVVSCVPGVGNLAMDGSAVGVWVRNSGEVSGDIFCRMIDDDNITIFDQTFLLEALQGLVFPWGGISFTMPERDYGIVIEVGHL